MFRELNGFFFFNTNVLDSPTPLYQKKNTFFLKDITVVVKWDCNSNDFNLHNPLQPFRNLGSKTTPSEPIERIRTFVSTVGVLPVKTFYSPY